MLIFIKNNNKWAAFAHGKKVLGKGIEGCVMEIEGINHVHVLLQ